MSNALAISGVTAVLQYYLNDMYSTAQGFSSTVNVSCLAPDQVTIGHHGAADVENQVNLFMHQVTHNAAWRNNDLAQMSSDGTRRLSNPPLALNLHYLLTAYGSDAWQAEALLGYAVMMLHEAPTLTRQDIRTAFQTLVGPPAIYPLNPLTPLLNDIGLADQIEMIKITPETMGREEMAWLWTALKADYRPTFAFLVSVVLMQPTEPANQALPVLRRVFGAQPMLAAQISQIQLKPNQTAALPGDGVIVIGENLGGAAQVSISNQRYGIQMSPTVTPSPGGAVTFSLPLEAVHHYYPAGVYDLAVQFVQASPGGPIVTQTSNVLPLAISPTLPTQTAVTAPVPKTDLTSVTVSGITPWVWPGQTVSLSLSTQASPYVSKSALAQPFPSRTDTLKFQFDPGLPTATPLLARLTVDGVTSQVDVQWTPFPPVFNGPWVTL
jgi:hypothetical protein